MASTSTLEPREKMQAGTRRLLHALHSVGLLIAIGLGGSSLEPDLLPARATHGVLHAYSPWFDGVVLRRDRFAEAMTARGMDRGTQNRLLVWLDRFGSPLVLTDNVVHEDAGLQAVAVRQQLTRELVDISGRQDLKRWQRQLWPRIHRRMKTMSADDREIFSEYLGVALIEWPDIKAGKTPTAIGDGLGLRPPLWRQVGPYSAGIGGGVEGFTESNVGASKQALQELSDVAQRSGLAGVRLPVSTLGSPADVSVTTRAIKRQSMLIGLRSRLGAEGLGLGGKVLLNIGGSVLPMARADTSRAGALIAIHSPIESIGHEWFHAFSIAAGQQSGVGGALWEINDEHRVVRSMQRAAQQISTRRGGKSADARARREARLVSKHFSRGRWQAGEFGLGSEAAAIGVGLRQFEAGQGDTGTYSAALTATHMFWPDSVPERGYSTWLGRRRMMDRMLAMSRYGGDVGVRTGYFASTEEWMAAAFQAEINLLGGENRVPSSLVSMPLPSEALLYSPIWQEMFRDIEGRVVIRRAED